MSHTYLLEALNRPAVARISDVGILRRYVAEIARFATEFTDRDLLVAVRDGVRLARPDAPAGCTQQAFDEVRGDLGGGGPMPSARQISTRLNARRAQRRSWVEWVALALDENASLERVAGRGRTDALAGDPPTETIAYAVGCAARSLGRVPSAVGYDGAREEMLLSVSRRVRHVFPTSAQILQVTDTWEAALALAGLEVAEPQRAGGGVPAADMIRAFVRANQAWPTKRALEQFGQVVGVRWRRPHQDERSLQDVVDEVRVAILETGGKAPNAGERWSADRGRPSVDVNAVEFDGALLAGKAWTFNETVAAVAVWLQSRSGREVTWRAYVAEAAGNPQLPGGSTITLLGGWGAVVGASAELLEKELGRSRSTC